jgi:hypothetical protein
LQGGARRLGGAITSARCAHTTTAGLGSG